MTMVRRGGGEEGERSGVDATWIQYRYPHPHPHPNIQHELILFLVEKSLRNIYCLLACLIACLYVRTSLIDRIAM